MSELLLQKLIDAKLAGTYRDAPLDHKYLFRSNEQAAKIAAEVVREHFVRENDWLRKRVEWLEGALIRAGGDPEQTAQSDEQERVWGSR